MKSGSYLIRWRGQQTGPYSFEALRERLEEGQIGLMHEIQVDGTWRTVDDFLQSIEHAKKAEQQAKIKNAQEEQQRRLDAQRELALQETQRQNDLLAEQLDEMRRQQGRQFPAPVDAQSQATATGILPGYTSQGTSGMAVAGFVCSLLNFVPFINFVSWVLALVFAHVALSNIRRTPGLGGRGLAVAALVITYALLALGFLAGLFLGLSGNGRLPRLF